MPEIRPFNRADRDQLTELVNAHIAAVVPGWGVSTAALLARLEREPNQYVVDPWVIERLTLVAYKRDRLVAAAHLKRYGTDERVMPDYCDAGEISWLVCWPHKIDAGHELARAATDQLDAWGVQRQYADGDLPTPATYGIHDCWPHVRTILTEAGFSDAEGRSEYLYAGTLDNVPEPGPAPVDGITVRREIANLTTRFVAVLNGEVVGYCHVRDDLSRGGTLSRLIKWADVWEWFVEPAWRRRGIATWLGRHAMAWLRLGGAERIIAPMGEEELGDGVAELYESFGWRRIGSCRRGWRRPVPAITAAAATAVVTDPLHGRATPVT